MSDGTTFTASQLRAIADALGDTDVGLTGSEIAHLLAVCSIADVNPDQTKRHRLYNAFAHDQNTRQHRRQILGFIRHSMKPERFAREAERFEPMRGVLNRALAFAGLSVDETGALGSAEQARTLPEAERRAQELRADLTTRGVHPDVLRFCRSELLADDYFHPVPSPPTQVFYGAIFRRRGSSVAGIPKCWHCSGHLNDQSAFRPRGRPTMFRDRLMDPAPPWRYSVPSTVPIG
jgi:hypothetical protein